MFLCFFNKLKDQFVTLTNNGSIFDNVLNYGLCYDPHHHYSLNSSTETPYDRSRHQIGQNCLYVDIEIHDHDDDDVENDENNGNYENDAGFDFDRQSQNDVVNDLEIDDLLQQIQITLTA